MEPYQLLELKHLIRDKMLEEALVEVSKIDTKRYKRVRIIFEFEFDTRGSPVESLEVRYRRPWPNGNGDSPK